MHNSHMAMIKIEHQTLSGGLWIAAWLFTIGFVTGYLGRLGEVEAAGGYRNDKARGRRVRAQIGR